jgi:REP element-mobilizing transposase RayT
MGEHMLRIPRGRYSRGYLPHIDWPTVQFLTFRLADSLPAKLLECWRTEMSHLTEMERHREEYQRVERYINLGKGQCLLRLPEVAEAFEEAMWSVEVDGVKIHAWVVMPNHVHLLASIPENLFLGDFMKALKGRSARECNRVLGRTGTFWFREYYDRFIRNQRHYEDTRAYIHRNAVLAGLCAIPEDWKFSSASDRGRAMLASRAAPTKVGGPGTSGFLLCHNHSWHPFVKV